MNKIKYSFILSGILFHFSLVSSQPLPEISGNSLWIDTDCGIDDYRAISMIISSSEFNIKAITVSDGNISPEMGTEKIADLLYFSSKDHNIPIGVGRTLHSLNPEWRDFVNSLTWGEKSQPSDIKPLSLQVISKLLYETNEKITVLALGPLTNIAELIDKKPESLEFIEKIIWYNENIEIQRGFNYLSDITSAERVIHSGLRIDIISNLDAKDAVFDLSLLTSHVNSQSKLAVYLNYFYSSNTIPGNRMNTQAILRDELAVLYLFNPELFNLITWQGNRMIRFNTSFNLPALKEVIHDMINGKYRDETYIIFNRFPTERDMFTYDVRQIMDSVIIRYGMEEWKACIIAGELHGHLGIYSVIGVKMGIKAREIFKTGPAVLQVKSFAGNIPPYSCLNDGLQVSSGATLGLNLITVVSDTEPEIMAEFSFKNTTARISLKQEYLDIIEADIKAGIVKFGLMDDGYWKMIRYSSLKYWSEWSRDEIFEIEIFQK